MEFKIEPAQRIKRLPPYLFGRLNALKLAKRRQGADIIDLGMGNPSDAAPQIVVDKLCEAAQDPRNHRYSASRGIKGLRKEIAKKYECKWNVRLDPETEVLACIGSKEGFSHLCLAMLGPGETAIVPDPAFPIHNYSVALAGANVISVPLGCDQKFIDNIAMVCENMYPKPKLLILNFPHNPTAMTVDKGFFSRSSMWQRDSKLRSFTISHMAKPVSTAIKHRVFFRSKAQRTSVSNLLL